MHNICRNLEKIIFFENIYMAENHAKWESRRITVILSVILRIMENHAMILHDSRITLRINVILRDSHFEWFSARSIFWKNICFFKDFERCCAPHTILCLFQDVLRFWKILCTPYDFVTFSRFLKILRNVVHPIGFYYIFKLFNMCF